MFAWVFGIIFKNPKAELSDIKGVPFDNLFDSKGGICLAWVNHSLHHLLIMILLKL
jgi:hypothetical protein